MAGSIGLGRMFQGAVDGIDRVQGRRDRETQRQRDDQQYQQQQSDRDYSLKRRDITDKRADRDFQRGENDRVRGEDFDQALNYFMGSKDPSAINDALNKYSTPDIGYDLRLEDDGSYSNEMTYKGKSQGRKPVTFDEIGKEAVGQKARDKWAAIEDSEKEAAGIKLDREKVKGEREFKREQARTKHDYDIALEKVKHSAKGGSKGSKEYKKQLAAASKEHRKIAVQNNGKLFEGIFSFENDDQKTTLAGYGTAVADAIYIASDDPNITTGVSGNQAYLKMKEFRDAAVKQAEIDKQENGLDDKDYDNRVIELIDYQAKKYIESLSEPSGPQLSREGGEQEETTGVNGKTVPLEEIKMLKDNPSDQMKQYFDEIYGEGSAEKILGGGKIVDPANKAPAPAGVSDSGAPSLMREANASTVPVEAPAEEAKPKLTRQERRRKGKRSQKEHGKIAVSEYKNEWKIMDDNEKVEWWTDNAQALKASSPRSHKKASKEIQNIRNKSKIGRNKKAVK